MEPVAILFGYPVSFSDVYHFAFLWLFPIIWGFMTSAGVWVMGQLDWLAPLKQFSPHVKTWLMRGVVAVSCAVVNVAGTWVLGGELSLALFQQAVVSYFAAVTAFEHARKAS
jgi:hypothetical protein